jgi:hypothetical protein
VFDLAAVVAELRALRGQNWVRSILFLLAWFALPPLFIVWQLVLIK